MIRKFYIGVNRQQKIDKFRLSHGGDDERHGAFEDGAIGEGDCDAMFYGCGGGGKPHLCGFDFLYFVDRVCLGNKKLIDNEIIPVDTIEDAEKAYQNKDQHYETNDQWPDTVVDQTVGHAASHH